MLVRDAIIGFVTLARFPVALQKEQAWNTSASQQWDRTALSGCCVCSYPYKSWVLSNNKRTNIQHTMYITLAINIATKYSCPCIPVRSYLLLQQHAIHRPIRSTTTMTVPTVTPTISQSRASEITARTSDRKMRKKSQTVSELIAMI